MPAGSNYRSLSSFTCLPHKAFTIHLLLSHPYSRVATDPFAFHPFRKDGSPLVLPG
jgi:hypothetical protein